jgi:hypothetical protein
MNFHPSDYHNIGAGSGNINPFSNNQREIYNNYIPQFKIRPTPKTLIPISSNNYLNNANTNNQDIVCSENDRTQYMLRMNRE